jgi:hypothetical protein
MPPVISFVTHVGAQSGGHVEGVDDEFSAMVVGHRVPDDLARGQVQPRGGPAVEILADAGYQGVGAQTGGRVVTPPHRTFKKNAPDWYEEIYERQRRAHSSRRIRVEHGIAHLKNWRALARHLGRRNHMSDTVQAIVGLLSHQQSADLTSAQQM